MTLLKQRLQTVITICFTLVLLILVWFLFNPFRTTTDLDSLRYIGPSAGRMMERHLEFYEGYEDSSIIEQAIHRFLFGTRETVQQEAIRVYEEVLKHYELQPEQATSWGILNTKTRKLVTIAETRGKDALVEALKDFTNNPEEEVIAEAVKFAYLEVDPHAEFNPEIFTGASLLPVGWAADHLRQHIARKVGNQKFANILNERLKSRGKNLRQNVLTLVLVMAAIIVVGIFLIIRLEVLHRPSPWQEGILTQPWLAQDGFRIAVISAVLGLIIWISLHIISQTFFKPSVFSMWATLFGSLPMLWLMHRYLLKPKGLTFRSAFGLSVLKPGLRNFLSVTLGLLAIEWVGLLLIGWGTWKLGMGSHWSHGMQERLVFGPEQTVILSAIGIVLWAPIFEEIGFRGLVYTTLRSRLTPTVAIVISATLFSSLHLNSIAGFLSIFWSGLILAYAYERYHSLLPGMVMHSVGNILNLSTILLFYR